MYKTVNPIKKSFFVCLACFASVLPAFTQEPTTPPTGSGDSSKARPKGVSPAAVQRVLAKIPKPKSPKARGSVQSRSQPTAPNPEPAEKIVPYKTPDINETTWYVKGEENGKKWAHIFSFKSFGVLLHEHYTMNGRVNKWHGEWKMVGDEIFCTLSFGYGSAAIQAILSIELKNGIMYGLQKWQGRPDWDFALESDEIENSNRFWRDHKAELDELWRTKQFQKLLPLYRKQAARFPSNDLQMSIADLYIELGDWKNAIAALDTGIQIAPIPANRFSHSAEQLLLRRAWVHYEKLKDFQKAARDLERAFDFDLQHFDVDNSLSPAFWKLVSINVERRNFGEAIRVCEKQIGSKSHVRKALGYERLAFVHENMGKIDLAIANITEAIKYAWDQRTLYQRRAELYSRVGNSAESSNDYINAAQSHLAVAKSSYGASTELNYLAACELYLRAKAIEFAKTICTDEKNLGIDFFQAKGYFSVEQGKFDEALTLLEKVPDSVFGLRMKARAYRGLNRVSEALAADKAAMDLEMQFRLLKKELLKEKW